MTKDELNNLYNLESTCQLVAESRRNLLNACERLSFAVPVHKTALLRVALLGEYEHLRHIGLELLKLSTTKERVS